MIVLDTMRIRFPYRIEDKHKLTSFVDGSCFEKYKTLKRIEFTAEKRFDPEVQDKDYVKFVQSELRKSF